MGRLGWYMILTMLALGGANVLFPASAPVGAWWIVLLMALLWVGAILVLADWVAEVMRGRNADR